MDFIIDYYNSEASGGLLVATTVGAIFLVTAIVLRRFSRPDALLRGLAFPFLLVSLILLVGGSFSGYNAKRALPMKVSLYQQSKQAFFLQEVAKVEGIHERWTGVRIAWGLIALTGLVILIVARLPYRKGIGIGLLALGLVAQIGEAFSYKRNEAYRRQVLLEWAAVNK